MTTPLQTVEQFLEATNERRDIAAASSAMSDEIRFFGPARRCKGIHQYVELLETFLPLHVGWKIHATFENGNQVCVIEEIVVRDPRGENLTLELAEWFTVVDGKIVEHRVYYDPREFITAFGMA
jgi:limonene-1,2-epoxide hydrolase